MKPTTHQSKFNSSKPKAADEYKLVRDALKPHHQIKYELLQERANRQRDTIYALLASTILSTTVAIVLVGMELMQ